jgi:hypothetical protein
MEATGIRTGRRRKRKVTAIRPKPPAGLPSADMAEKAQFDEPAVSGRNEAVSVEYEPDVNTAETEERDVCSICDEAREDSSDLH